MLTNVVRYFSKQTHITVRARGKDVLTNPNVNKGMAFSHAERDRLGIKGLIPPRQQTIEAQTERILHRFREPHLEPMDKWLQLQALQDRNETLFYRIITNNIEEMAPIVYTPTVGLVCQTFSDIYRSARGMYFSITERGEYLPMVYNWPSHNVDIIVVTDGSRILGLGDLGVQGMGISIGKLVLYVAGAGIYPMKTLPVCIDVGTNNKDLIASPLYLGRQQLRANDKEYFEVFDEFMKAVYERWPNVLVQFEDIQNERAVALLQKYRNTHLCFNDDIQGTGAMTVAGIMCSLRTKGLPLHELVNQRFVVVGAGSAGIGVVNSLAMSMRKLGASEEKIRSCFHFVDQKGLMTAARNLATLSPGQDQYLRPEKHLEGVSLLKTIQEFRPHVLLGLSGAGGVFTEEICREMSRINTQPVIFPMSNPVSKAECNFEVAFKATNGSVIFASGSPFPNITLDNGEMYYSNQANNMFIFPGLGLGAIVAKCSKVSDGMLIASSEALAKCIPEEDVKRGVVYPRVDTIRDVSRKIALAVILQARAEGITRLPELANMSEEDIEALIVDNMYQPNYQTIIQMDHD